MLVCVATAAITMQHISFILLLFVGFCGSLEDSDSSSRLFELKPETIEDVGVEGELQTNLTREDDEQNSAILNTLMAFGIDDVEFRAGQILCPLSNYSSANKRRRIVLGLVGCNLDPTTSQFTPEQRELLERYHNQSAPNCTDSIDLAGYIPPVPGI